MNKLIWLLIFFIVGCNVFKGPKGDSGTPGQSCNVVQTTYGAVIECPNSTATVDNGKSCSVFSSTNNGAVIECQDGTYNLVSGCSLSNSVITCGNSQLFIDNVTMVQFCPSFSNTYGSFPEWGICSNSVLYAVYWSGVDAWMAEISPGNYVSTSQTNPCSFTVQPNCIIGP